MRTRTIVLELDDDDYDAVQEEITHRQTRMRDQYGTILPDGHSNLAGAIIAELVRDIQEYRSMYDQTDHEPPSS